MTVLRLAGRDLFGQCLGVGRTSKVPYIVTMRCECESYTFQYVIRERGG